MGIDGRIFPVAVAPTNAAVLEGEDVPNGRLPWAGQIG